MVNVPKGQENIVNQITPECRQQVMRIAELQADDYHLDRPLFLACRADREKFCSQVPAGQGKVFQCLIEHRNEKTMEPDVKNNFYINKYWNKYLVRKNSFRARWIDGPEF